MQTIPLLDTPFQNLQVSLGGQNCTISVSRKTTGLYLNLSVDNKPVVSGVLCHNLNLIVRDKYRGFAGDLFFQDTQGLTDPDTPGLGSRWLLQYLEASDVA